MRNFKRIIIFVLILLIIFFAIKICNNRESFINKRTNIAIIIPTTSNKRSFKNIREIDFFKIFLPSFLKTCSNDYNYNFYIGIDHDDKFFIKQHTNLINHFKKVTNNKSNYSISVEKMYNLKGKVGEIWSNLAKTAINNNNEYLYQLGDDIKFLTSGWEKLFINKLKELNNIGVVGPLDIKNKHVLSQSFVHKTHLKIFDKYYPDRIKNWYIDNWIQDVYKPNRFFMFKDIQVENDGGSQRYEIKRHDPNDLKVLVESGKKKIDNYIKKIVN